MNEGTTTVLGMTNLRTLALAAGILLAAATGCGRPVKTPPKMESSLPAEKAPLVSGKNTRVYHTRECRYARDIPDLELMGYDNPDLAERTGRFPCAVCHPRETFAISEETMSQGPPPEPRPAR